MTTNAWSSLARKASPIIAPDATNHRVRPSSIARVMEYADATSSSTSAASGLLKRNMRTATGVVAITAPAIRPAPAPNHLLMVRYRSPTAATPSSASGTRMLHEFTPNTLAMSSIGHSASGVLSTVIEFAASLEPNRNAFQLTVPACTAAE